MKAYEEEKGRVKIINKTTQGTAYSHEKVDNIRERSRQKKSEYLQGKVVYDCKDEVLQGGGEEKYL